MKLNSLLYLPAALVLLLVSACATPLKQEQLIPEMAPIAVHPTGKHIQVDPVIVTDVPKPSWTQTPWQHLDQQTFSKTIIDTLDRSGLFSTVSVTGPAEYRLSAELEGQRLVGTYNSIMLLLVRYQLIDQANDDVLWTENLLSFHHLPASEVFMGSDRVAQVFETAVRKNMQKLVSRLQENLAPMSVEDQMPAKAVGAADSGGPRPPKQRWNIPQSDVDDMADCKSVYPDVEMTWDPLSGYFLYEGKDAENVRRCLVEKHGWFELGKPEFAEGTMAAPRRLWP